ncbi:MAG: hybrid sensor histidine kinase/response regulator [Gammaproteobacteria bacterium]|nr:MAG: hybrid sensor histidine kinase/response regulator [Gammaproteobacteria bacterium]
MISQPLLMLVALCCVLLLFLVALWAERQREWHNRLRPYIYSLTLAVYCSSWTFFGAVGSAAHNAWAYLPIYLGPILVFVFGAPVLRKLVHIGTRQKTTSIADFIGSRYGKRQLLAALVAMVAVVGSIPYISLQLKAVSLAWDTLAGSSSGSEAAYLPDSALITALMLALFAMVFGTRHIEGRERNRGMMAALAVESVIKIVALVMLAGLALVMAAHIEFASLLPRESLLEPWMSNPIDTQFVTMVLLSMLAIICLPRQFHVTVVEYQGDKDLQVAHWFFPLYLLVIVSVVLPIAIVGAQLFTGSGISPDTYVLALPMTSGSELLAILAFAGGFSAATGMVIVATVTLSIMVSNEIILPLLLRWRKDQFRQTAFFMGQHLRWIRRVCILIILLASWFMYRMMGGDEELASIGLVSFACFAQLSPALLGGAYWRRGHAIGVYAGLAVGFLFWWYCLLLPTLLSPSDNLLLQGPWQLHWLRPQALLGLDFLDPLSHGVFWSLSCNLLIYIGVSLLVKPSDRDSFQASEFVDVPGARLYGEDDYELSPIRVVQLRQLMESFLSVSQQDELWRGCEERYRQRLLDNDRAPVFVVRRVERYLAAIVGSASAQSAITLLQRTEPLQFSDIAAIVGGTSEQLQFNRDLLQTTVETITQGICVVDGDLRVVAWNRRYEQMFDYPPRLLYVGCPIKSVYEFNAKRGLYRDSDNLERQVERRLDLLRRGGSHRFERTLPNGTTIQVVGNPMPNGGFVATYTDISDYKAVVKALEEAKSTLEERVAQRTSDLSNLNFMLAEENRLRARAEDELRDMHASKSRFMQAASHDLLQPISAAKLFITAIQHQLSGSTDVTLTRPVNHVQKSLETAEKLIAALREIAGLEGGRMQAEMKHFCIGSMLRELATEFDVLAVDKGISLHFVPCQVVVESDPHLLRRILQNFLSNAIHYTKRGRLLLGCRRTGDGVRIEVWDTGPGIAPDAMDRIFMEFERLSPGATSTDKGLGLGLTIAKGMADLMGHKIGVRSSPGEGSVFSILVPYGQLQELYDEPERQPLQQPRLRGVSVLCIDNEEEILEGMKSLLNQWGCHVMIARGPQELGPYLKKYPPQILLVDYHLEENLTGVEMVKSLPQTWRHRPCMIISADNSDEIRTLVEQAGFTFMSKPVVPERLAKKITSLVRPSRMSRR